MDILYIRAKPPAFDKIICHYRGKTAHIPIGGFTQDEIETLHGVFSLLTIEMSNLQKEHDDESSIRS